MHEIRAAYRAVFNFHERWQHLPTAPPEMWCEAAKELPSIATTPLSAALLMAVWDELERQRKEAAG